MAVISGQTSTGVTTPVLVDANGKIFIVEGSSTTFLEFQTAVTVPTNTETTVLDFTNTGTAFAIEAISATGEAAGQWFIYINDVLKVQQRTTAADMNLDLNMHSFILVNTDKVTVKVEHYETATQDFACTLHYGR